MDGKCKFCQFIFSADDEKTTFQHLQTEHGKLLCTVCNESFPYKEHGETLEYHYNSVKHWGFNFCNKKKCLNRIFQIGSKHKCVHPLPKKPKQRKRRGRKEEEAKEEENEEEDEDDQDEAAGTSNN